MDVFDLFAKISLDTGEYESGLDRAGKDANAFGEALKGLGGGIGALAKAVDEGFQSVDALLGNVPALLDGHAGELAEAGTEAAALLLDGFSSSGGRIADNMAEWIPLIADRLLSCRERLVSAGAEIPGAVGAGMAENLPSLAEAALPVMTALAGGISEAVPALRPAAAGIVPEIAGMLTGPDSLGVLPGAAAEILDTLAEAFAEAAPDLLDGAGETGAAVVEGIWQGIQSAAGQFREDVTGFLGGIVDGVKEVLGIRSPSRVFAGIGENMAAGLGEGWESELRRVRDRIADGLDFGTPSIGLESRGGGGAANPSYDGGAIRQDIVINLTAELDGSVLARRMVRHNARAETLAGGSMVTISQ